MIVWLASYPRSGNTLLRTVLYKTMGLESASDEVGEKKVVGLTEVSRRSAGIIEIPGSWENFYQAATQSDEIFLVKTHRPPRDNQPVIYVVRDGRKACLSYSRFHQRFTSQPYPSLLDIVLGDDFYGGWSEHYRAWVGRENTVMVRYEDLVNAPSVLLRELAGRVRYSGEIVPWKNPFDQLHQENPDFFRKGEVGWQGAPDWTPWINAIFFYLHGDLMIELGYASPEMVAEAKSDIPEDWLDLVEVSRRLLSEKKQLERICDDRQVVIDGLKQASDERLELIHKLTKSRQ